MADVVATSLLALKLTGRLARYVRVLSGLREGRLAYDPAPAARAIGTRLAAEDARLPVETTSASHPLMPCGSYGAGCRPEQWRLSADRPACSRASRLCWCTGRPTRRRWFLGSRHGPRRVALVKAARD